MKSPFSALQGNAPLRLFTSICTFLQREHERSTRIRELNHMMKLDPHILRDIGVSRDEIRYTLHTLRRTS